MAGVEELDLAGWIGAAADERSVLTSQRAVAEETIDVNHDLRQRQTHADEAAEERVQLGHPHGCGHALSGDVAEHEVELTAEGVEVAIVAADRPQGRVVIAGFPAVHFQIRGRKEGALQLGGKVEIALKVVALVPGEMVKAILDERVGQEPVPFDGVMAGFAQAVRASGKAVQGGIHFAQEGGHVGVIRRQRDGGFKAALSFLQLAVQEVHFDGCHSSTLKTP